jgi:hypothetical protein
MNRITPLIFVFAAFAAGQDIAAGQEKVTVPLSDPARPATVKARLVTGSITVTVGSGPQVVVETEPSRASGREARGNAPPAPPVPPPPPGMHRIDIGGRGINVEEDHNTVTIGAGFGGTNLRIQVPVNTSVELGTVNGGEINVAGINGDIDVNNVNGFIELKDVSGAVSATTVNGSVTVSLTHVAPDKPMSFSSLNGKVDVTLPADTKARLRLKTTNGAIYSDFDVKMEADTAKPVIEDARGQGGRYRIRMDRGSSVNGSINGGGPEYSFQTMNGVILLHRK